MRFEIAAPAEVREGDPVLVSLRLTNVTDRPLTVYLQGRPTAFDIVVRREDGAVLWRRLEGQAITAILGLRTLEPHTTVTFEDAWPQRDQAGHPVPPGRYTLVGRLLTDGDPLTTRPTTVWVRPSH